MTQIYKNRKETFRLYGLNKLPIINRNNARNNPIR